MKYMTLILAVSLAAPLQAATTCMFTQECLEGEACAETSYGAEISATEGGTPSLSTDAETLPGQVFGSGNTRHYVFEGASAAHFLTHYADGAARYTIHMDGPFTITYHGSCEGTP